MKKKIIFKEYEKIKEIDGGVVEQNKRKDRHIHAYKRSIISA